MPRVATGFDFASTRLGSLGLGFDWVELGLGKKKKLNCFNYALPQIVRLLFGLWVQVERARDKERERERESADLAAVAQFIINVVAAAAAAAIVVVGKIVAKLR